jgi:hypothetical protein
LLKLNASPGEGEEKETVLSRRSRDDKGGRAKLATGTGNEVDGGFYGVTP